MGLPTPQGLLRAVGDCGGAGAAHLGVRVFAAGAVVCGEVTVQGEGKILRQLQTPGWCLEATCQALLYRDKVSPVFILTTL